MKVNLQSQSVSSRAVLVRTPIADRLAELRKVAGKSFHALPLSAGASIADCRWRGKYDELFGRDYLHSELTITGKHFDSFFFAENEIKEAEELAAMLYGADHTLFVTTGTTTSNQIAVTALYQPKTRVLMDKHCHQSLHFALHGLNARVDHLRPLIICENSGRSIFDINELLEKTLTAESEGDPYELIVLNAHSYDGVIYNVPAIIEFLLDSGITTRRFVIDEAWAAANYFHDRLRRYAAMNISSLRKRYPDLSVVATQSAHKSLSCLRQASMVHFRGPSELAEKLRVARFRLHTTSPSYPILASLDLARAQMQDVGSCLVEQASMLAGRFEDAVATDPGLSSYRINHFPFPSLPFNYADADPTKVSLNVSEFVTSVADMRDLLYSRYGIYLNRLTETSLLLNFHIGVDHRVVDELLAALRKLQCGLVPEWLSCSSAESFIIPYPPGVPLILPGEEITAQLLNKIRDIRRSGSRVFTA